MVTKFEVSKSYKHKTNEKVVKILAVATTGDYLAEVLEGGILNTQKGGTVLYNPIYGNWEPFVEKKTYYVKAYVTKQGRKWLGDLHDTYEGAEKDNTYAGEVVTILKVEFRHASCHSPKGAYLHGETMLIIAAVVLQVTLSTPTPGEFEVIRFERNESFNKCLEIRNIIREEYKAKGIRASVTCKRKDNL